MRRAALLLIPITLIMAACSDDETAPDEAFQVTIAVVDAENNPVPDLELLVLMDSPWYQDGLQAAKAAVSIRWDQAVPCSTRVTIEDAAGGLVRNLWSGEPPAGAHRVMWIGDDDDGVHQASGLYWAHLVATRDDTVLYDARQPMYMAIMDFERTVQGVTDAAGRIVLTDKRLFPLLYGQVDMMAVNESGELMGDFPLVFDMRLYLRDPRYGHIERFDRAVTRSGQRLVLRCDQHAADDQDHADDLQDRDVFAKQEKSEEDDAG